MLIGLLTSQTLNLDKGFNRGLLTGDGCHGWFLTQSYQAIIKP